MHIAEGVLGAEVLIGSYAAAIIGTAIGLRKLDFDRIPQAGVLSASFFVASLVHVPLAFTSVHLILNGLIGAIMGWGAFPVILVALGLQVVFFQFGGFSTLGANTLVMALPAVACYLLFRPFFLRSTRTAVIAAFLCGFTAILLSAALLGLLLVTTGEQFTEIAAVIAAAHLPVMVIEGIITVFCIQFLKKVQPSILGSLNVQSSLRHSELEQGPSPE